MRALPLAAVLVVGVPSFAFATTYEVGPDKPYASLDELAYELEPGDLVLVDGDTTYSGGIHIRPDSSGTAEAKVTIRGVIINGRRPHISGGDDYGIVLNANHMVFESFEVTGAARYCMVHKSDDLTIRDVVVHDCPNIGILSTDTESGSLTIEYSEFYGSGEGDKNHQLYLASDEVMYPGSVFRLQHSYIHDGTGGHNVKTRAERNEIYCNWIENPVYHVIDIVEPDGQKLGLAREDSDIVGNVLIQNGYWYISRMGGDHGVGGNRGRHRFAFNTIVSTADSQTFFYLQDEVESLALHNNVFLLAGDDKYAVKDEDAIWMNGRQIAATNNFVASGITADDFVDSVTGSPGLIDAGNFDFRPADGSSLIDASGAENGPSGYEVPDRWPVPNCVPAMRQKNNAGVPLGRPQNGTPDIGALEFGTEFEPGTGGAGPTGGSGSGASSQGGSGAGAGSEGGATSGPSSSGAGGSSGSFFPVGVGDGDGDGDGSSDDGGADAASDSNEGGCGTRGAISRTGGAMPFLGLALLFGRRRRPRSARSS